MATKTLTAPVVHLNGTSAEALIRGYADASDAVTRAISALAEAAPNGRDYPGRLGEAFNRAQREHLARLHALQGIRAELAALADAVDERRQTAEVGA